MDLDIPRLPDRRTLLTVIVGFFLLTFALYGRGLWSEFVRWDDGLLVFENPAIREISWRSLTYIFTHFDPELYIPLTFLSYQIDYQIGGINPFIYHIDNLVLHTLNALLVTWLTLLLTRRQWAAILCGVLFAVHPLHTEAVAWVSARKDVLSTFFFLLSVIQYLYFRESGRRLWLSVLFFILGLMAKVMVVTLPVLLLLIDWKDGRRLFSVHQLREKWPYAAAALLFGLIAVFGKTGVISSTTPWVTLLMAFKSTAFYLQKLIVPTGLSVLYPYYDPVTLSSPDFFVPVVVVLSLAGLALWSLKHTREIAFGAAFFLLTLLPTFINFSKGDYLYFASDRYAYTPSIGFLLIVAFILRRWVEASSSTVRNVTRTLAGLFVITLSLLTVRQASVWGNSESLFQNVLAHYPRSHIAHNNIGNVYRLQGRYDDALREYQAALSIVPDEALNNIGNVYRAQGKVDDAARALEQALHVRSQVKTLSNLGALYRKQGKLDEALAQYRKALAIDPESKEAHLGLGVLYATQRMFAQAQVEYRTAIRIDPRYEEAHTNLGAALYAEGKVAEAVDAYTQALSVNPFFPDARFNLAVALTSLGREEEAIGEYEQVIRGVPTYIPARINLALLLYASGDHDGARAQFEQILRIDPRNAAATKALQQMGEAIT